MSKMVILLWALVNSAFASPEVLSFRGKATWNDKSIVNAMKLEGKGRLKTEEASTVILKWDEYDSEIRLAPDSAVVWDTQNNSPELVSGKILCTIHTKPATGNPAPAQKNVFSLRTRAAVMGVRGTKFMGISNPILSEAEIVVFQGVVDFRSTQTESDFRTITEGHWGGIGGRFGNKTTTPVKLPVSVLSAFLASKDLKTPTVEEAEKLKFK